MASNSLQETYSNELKVYVNQEKAAVDLLNSIGKLLFDKSIELVIFRNHLVDSNITEILRLHKYAAEVVNRPISVFDTADIARALYKMDLAPAKIDIGKLASEWFAERERVNSLEDFLEEKLGNFLSDGAAPLEPRDVVLYGFGRIGRLAARELIKQAGKGQQLRLRAIVLRSVDEKSLVKRAALLENDSVHGRFGGTIDVDHENQMIVVNGQRVKFIEAKDPSEVDYTAHGINNALLIDNTGAFRDDKELGLHLKSNGISKVILTAPGKGIPNVVYGINHRDLHIEKENIFSAASCTTNAISPILKVVEDLYGVEKGHVETVHAYTNDQNLLDNMHKKERRGRSAAVNMVITETGAGKAVTKVIPSLSDKLTANAVRVPTPNGSLAIMHLQLNKETSVEEINNAIRNAALEGDLVNQIYYSINPEMVSNDIIGNECCAVFDSPATIVSPDKKSVVLYTWYDNEFGYTKQVIRLAKYVAKVRRNIYY
ncbi:MAG: glyceraldehyde-3-phosphate dehydrogenase [Flavobacteriales bacterium]|nr:glyceraldehyde-3-phosphate dehydrogenase [Flavobacteriales bacterium]MDG1779873.1 glyceraldehyde-3-phosphate dehydrogenase [Flavobacteriales bacterium]